MHLECDVPDGITDVATAAAVGLCSRASSAPTGQIDVTFNAKYQAVIIAIVPVFVYPQKMVTLTCGTRTNVAVVTVSTIFTSFCFLKTIFQIKMIV